jgi:hypothetical protein
MGADIYDWERVHGKGSYQKLIDGGCSEGMHQAGCSHGEPPYVPPATAALEAAWQATAGMIIQSGEPWERVQRAEFIVAAIRAAWPVIAAAEREAVTADRERIAGQIEALAANYPEDVFPPDGISPDAIGGTAMRHAYRNAARVIREEGEDRG